MCIRCYFALIARFHDVYKKLGYNVICRMIFMFRFFIYSPVLVSIFFVSKIYAEEDAVLGQQESSNEYAEESSMDGVPGMYSRKGILTISRAQLVDLNRFSLIAVTGLDTRRASLAGGSLGYNYSSDLDFSMNFVRANYQRKRALYAVDEFNVQVQPYFYEYFFGVFGVGYQQYHEYYDASDKSLAREKNDGLDTESDQDIQWDMKYYEDYQYRDLGIWLSFGIGSRIDYAVDVLSLNGLGLAMSIEFQKMILQIEESYKNYRPIAGKVLGMNDAIVAVKFSAHFLL